MDLFKHKTIITTKIESVTDEQVIKEDYAQIMQICDHVNYDKDGPKEALRVIVKRLKNKNPKVVLLTLKVLEACVNNCGLPFHERLVNKGPLTDIVKMIKTENLNNDAQEKILDLLQIWAIGLAYDPSLSQVNTIYRELLDEGFEFPQRDLDVVGLISEKPQISKTNLATMNYQSVLRQGNVETDGVIFSPPPANFQPAYMTPSQNFIQQYNPPRQQQMNPEEMKQRRMESISSMQASIDLFSETLAYADPSQEDLSTNSLIKECYDRCKGFQPQLTQMLVSTDDDESLAQLLTMNDELNSKFEYYQEAVAKYQSIQSVSSNHQSNPEYSQFSTQSTTQQQNNNFSQPLINTSSSQNQDPFSFHGTSNSESQIKQDILGLGAENISDDQLKNDFEALGLKPDQISSEEESDDDEADFLMDPRKKKEDEKDDLSYF